MIKILNQNMISTYKFRFDKVEVLEFDTRNNIFDSLVRSLSKYKVVKIIEDYESSKATILVALLETPKKLRDIKCEDIECRHCPFNFMNCPNMNWYDGELTLGKIWSNIKETLVEGQSQVIYNWIEAKLDETR